MTYLRSPSKKRRQRRGITNVLGAILFVFAIVALTSIIAVVSIEYGGYIRSADYLSTVERERSQEDILFTHASDIDGQLKLNITNIGSETITLNNILVHNKSEVGSIDVTSMAALPITLNPGMVQVNYRIPGMIVTPTTNCTIAFVSSRGNVFIIVIQGLEIYPPNPYH